LARVRALAATRRTRGPRRPSRGRPRGPTIIKVLAFLQGVFKGDATCSLAKMRQRRLSPVVWNPDAMVASCEGLEEIERQTRAPRSERGSNVSERVALIGMTPTQIDSKSDASTPSSRRSPSTSVRQRPPAPRTSGPNLAQGRVRMTPSLNQLGKEWHNHAPRGMGDTGLEPVTSSLSSLGRTAQPCRITASWAMNWATRTAIVQS
jgi:hypothetical protein